MERGRDAKLSIGGLLRQGNDTRAPGVIQTLNVTPDKMLIHVLLINIHYSLVYIA